jgi:hypothetical protein
MPLLHTVIATSPFRASTYHEQTWHFPIWWERKNYIPTPSTGQEIGTPEEREDRPGSHQSDGHTWPSRNGPKLTVSQVIRWRYTSFKYIVGDAVHMQSTEVLPVGFSKGSHKADSGRGMAQAARLNPLSEGTKLVMGGLG